MKICHKYKKSKMKNKFKSNDKDIKSWNIIIFQ